MTTVSTHEPDAAAIRAILESRARELAKLPEVEDRSVKLVELVEFRLGQEHYAFPSSEVREVFQLTEITPLPSLPSFVLGVANVRGRILSVIDIRRLLEFTETGMTNLNRAIILNSRAMEVAVLADEIVGVYTSDANRWQRSMPTLFGKQEAYLLGVTDKRVVVLDAKGLLASRDLPVESD